METQESALGVCSVHKLISPPSFDGVGQEGWDGDGLEGQKILCLDGGGMKVNAT